ncbi:hypothetical protein SSPO_003610 [Streptomyces antimycoticus]|uniref:Uncharacterized protein n=1 Tax=Streptomyces antimycoticus TaxID=68175 RepID=A0A499UAJ6_9ACTN|nr:hypothetical protein SSPO_003610 [Streptomyces antimycoticus]
MAARPRPGLNFATGEPMQAGPMRVVRFRPGTRFNDLVSGLAPLPASGNCIQKTPRPRARTPSSHPPHRRPPEPAAPGSGST